MDKHCIKDRLGVANYKLYNINVLMQRCGVYPVRKTPLKNV